MGDLCAKMSSESDPVLEYTTLDRVLQSIVLPTGESLRYHQPRPRKMTGTRILRGHTSSTWLEGNKVIFEYFEKDTIQAIQACTDGLVQIWDKVDVMSLPKDEQLAYWFNLHNFLVLSEIAKRYPVREPYKLRVGPNNEPLHTAPLITIRGVALSLQDIRLNIVQRYWKDPRVLYGFFRGDIASPNLLTHAWHPATLDEDLDSNAVEFVNSLRGVEHLRKQLIVSPVYKEAKAQLFPHWPEDFRTHLRAFAKPKVEKILAKTNRVTFGRYQTRVAALSGGDQQLSTTRLRTPKNIDMPNFGIRVFHNDVLILKASSTLNKAKSAFQKNLIEKKRQQKQRESIEIIDLDPESDNHKR